MSARRRPADPPAGLLVVRLPLDELVPDPDNPRSHPDRNLEAVRASLAAHGQVEPLVVQASTRIVIAGNARLEVLRERQAQHADVVLLDVDDRTRRKLAVALNRSAELAGWNTDRLSDLVDELREAGDLDLAGLGFTQDELGALLASGQQPDEAAWADAWDAGGDTSDVDQRQQLTIILPPADLARLKAHLATWSANKNRAVLAWLDASQPGPLAPVGE